MRKTKVLLLFTIALALFAPQVSAYFFYVNYSCSDDKCFEGNLATWHIIIENQAARRIEFSGFELFDAINDTLITEKIIPYYPQRVERGDVITVWGHSTVMVNLTAPLPAANVRSDLTYYPCITNIVLDSYQLAKYGEYERRHCFDLNFSLPSLQCTSNEQCSADSTCSQNKCTRLVCGSCQYFEDHACHDYECCSHNDCLNVQTCNNQTKMCQDIQCAFDQYIYNRTCITIECREDEFLENKLCKKLNCLETEGFVNHTCQPLHCQDNEFVTNNSCQPLGCKEAEYAFNHECLPLHCEFDEAPRNHQCQKLECSFYENIHNHQCITNTRFVLKFAVEIIAFIVILTFIILDIRIHRMRRLKAKQRQAMGGSNLFSKK